MPRENEGAAPGRGEIRGRGKPRPYTGDVTRGRFLVLEGPDGSGKSTQAALLVIALGGRGESVDHLRDPGGTAAGDAIRHSLLKSSRIRLGGLSCEGLAMGGWRDLSKSEISDLRDRAGLG